MEDGLPVESLTQVVQTRDGYLWISTFDGLARFDGARFTLFDTERIPALSTNRIVVLRETGDGSLWILGEDRFLARRDPEGRFESAWSEEVEHVPTEDHLGGLWLVTAAGELLERRSGEWTLYRPEQLDGHRVTAVFLDHQERLWVATSRGIGVLEDDAPLRLLEVDRVAPGLEPISFATDAEGDLWSGWIQRETHPTRYGACRLNLEALTENPATQHFRCLDEDLLPEVSGDGTVWFRHLPPTLHRLRGGRYERLIDASPSAPWWLSNGPRVRSEHGVTWILQPKGLYRDDGDGEGEDLEEIFTVDSETLTSFVIDHEGTIWLTTDTAGLIALKPTRIDTLGVAEGLGNRMIYPILEDREGSLWVGGRGPWLSKIALDGSVTGSVTTWHDLPIHDVALSFFEEEDGSLLVGAVNGLFRFREGRLEPIQTTRPEVRGIFRLRDGTLLLGMDNSLFKHPAGALTGDDFSRRLKRVEEFPPHIPQVFHTSADGTIWIGTAGGGLLRGDPEATRFTRVEGLSNDHIRAIYEDEHGILWFGTVGGGLNRLDPAHPERGVSVITKREGLFDNGIHRILDDGHGRLWMSSNRGIFRVRKNDLDALARGELAKVESVAYTENDGLRHREANGGVREAGLRARDGRLWFPTMDGLAIIDPVAISEDLPPPPVHIEALYVGGGEHPIFSGAVRLEPEDRNFRIEYTALSLRDPEDALFRYRLEGYDDAWHEAGNRRSAAFTKVPPGKYVFSVQGRSGDGIWNREGARLVVEIRPFPYEALWFRGLVILVVATFVGVIIGSRERYQQARREELARAVDERTEELHREKEVVARQARELAELDRVKSEFFANISHEFRTPLTLTLGPLRDLRAGLHGPLGVGGSRQVELAYSNAGRLLMLINQLLDISRLEAGGIRLRASEDDLVLFATLAARRFQPFAVRRKISFTAALPDREIPVYYDFEQLDKVLANLLTNALKFTSAGGEITLGVEAVDGWAIMTVRDTGRGMAEEELGRIFERFYQVDSSSLRKHPGSGLGLALSRELMELHGGKLEVESRLGFGSLFRAKLRLGRDHLHADQIVAPDSADASSGPGSFSGLSSDGLFAVDAILSEIALGHSEDLVDDPDDDPEEAGEEVLSGEGEVTILIVDDHRDLRAYLRGHLGKRYRVIEAANGRLGLEKARRLVPDLVVSDVMMPEMDGFDFCRALREDPELDWLPLILLTAKAVAEARLEGLGVGADDYLTKPFDVAELLARIENLITSRRRLRRRFRAEGARHALEEAGGSAEGIRSVPFVSPSEPPSEDELFLARVAEVIDAELTEESFDVEALARAVAMGRTKLFTRLKELTGKPPSQLLLERRLEVAAVLLASGGGQVSEVAYGVGFKTAAHFSRKFREIYGVTPSAYQKSGRRQSEHKKAGD